LLVPEAALGSIKSKQKLHCVPYMHKHNKRPRWNSFSHIKAIAIAIAISQYFMQCNQLIEA